jgi:hypothetical protein
VYRQNKQSRPYNPCQSVLQWIWYYRCWIDFRVALDYYPAKVGDKFWYSSLANIQFYDVDQVAIYSDIVGNYTDVNGVFTILASIEVKEAYHLKILLL